MQISTTTTATATADDLVAIFVQEGKAPALPDGAPPADHWEAEFSGKKGESLLLHGADGARWLLVGLGGKGLDAERFREAGGTARNRAEKMERPNLFLDLSGFSKVAAGRHAASVAEGAALAGYDPAILKEDRKEAKVQVIKVLGTSGDAGVRKTLKRAGVVAAANHCARDLQNMPPNILSPLEFANQAREVAKDSKQVKVKVLKAKQMLDMAMGSLLGVAKGSAFEPHLVHMTYTPTRKKPKGVVAVVGKGLTFDSGGISIKPSAGMDEMKFDMSGAAAVLGLFHGLANGAECPYEVHGILGCVENMPGGNAQRPGDIVTAMNGKTIEVLNTDAEGRLVLADCLTYAARKIKPDRIYDLATLTGAVIHALGHETCGIFSSERKMISSLEKVGRSVGELCWELPLFACHREYAKGDYADLKNIFARNLGAGSTAGAAFLSWFVDEVPWAHIDIAGTAWEGGSKSYMSKGGRGFGTRLMLELLRD